MRLLLDENGPFRLAPALRHRGHDITVIGHDYPRQLTDEDVLAIACAEQRVLITNDLDFGNLIVRQGLAHAGVILLRLEGLPFATKLARLETVLREHADAPRAFIVVTETAARIRTAGRPASA
jgi:predicted nuclease of predicted toxin-antitoxin system